jgi:hypothetical protein
MHLGPERLRAVIGAALAAGTFVVCHDALTYGGLPDYGPAICRGFFDAYARQSLALILLRAYPCLTEVPRPPTAPRSRERDARASPGVPGRSAPAVRGRHRGRHRLRRPRHGAPARATPGPPTRMQVQRWPAQWRDVLHAAASAGRPAYLALPSSRTCPSPQQ